jgi:hypothetical protein
VGGWVGGCGCVGVGVGVGVGGCGCGWVWVGGCGCGWVGVGVGGWVGEEMIHTLTHPLTLKIATHTHHPKWMISQNGTRNLKTKFRKREKEFQKLRNSTIEEIYK